MKPDIVVDLWYPVLEQSVLLEEIEYAGGGYLRLQCNSQKIVRLIP